jgi:hypothetical protein
MEPMDALMDSHVGASWSARGALNHVGGGPGVEHEHLEGLAQLAGGGGEAGHVGVVEPGGEVPPGAGHGVPEVAHVGGAGEEGGHQEAGDGVCAEEDEREEPGADVGLHVSELGADDAGLVGQPSAGPGEVPLGQGGLLQDERVGGLGLGGGGQGGAGGVEPELERLLLEGGVVDIDAEVPQRLRLPHQPGPELVEHVGGVQVVERGEVPGEADELGAHVGGGPGGEPDGPEQVAEGAGGF